MPQFSILPFTLGKKVLVVSVNDHSLVISATLCCIITSQHNLNFDDNTDSLTVDLFELLDDHMPTGIKFHWEAFAPDNRHIVKV